MLLGFILELGHAGKLPELGVAVQKPGQLRVGVHVALDKEQAFVQVDAAGQHQRVGREGVGLELLRVLADSDGVLVDDAVGAVVLVLQRAPVFDRTQVVAQGECAAGRLDAGDLFALRFDFGVGGEILVFHVVLLLSK